MTIQVDQMLPEDDLLAAPDQQVLKNLLTPDARMKDFFTTDSTGKKIFNTASVFKDYEPEYVQSVLAAEKTRTQQLADYLKPYQESGRFAGDSVFSTLQGRASKGLENIDALTSHYNTGLRAFQQAAEKRAAEEATQGGLMFASKIPFYGKFLQGARMLTQGIADKSDQVTSGITENLGDDPVSELVKGFVQTEGGMQKSIANTALDAIDPILEGVGRFVGDGETEADRARERRADLQNTWYQYQKIPGVEQKRDAFVNYLKQNTAGVTDNRNLGIGYAIEDPNSTGDLIYQRGMDYLPSIDNEAILASLGLQDMMDTSGGGQNEEGGNSYWLSSPSLRVHYKQADFNQLFNPDGTWKG